MDNLRTLRDIIEQLFDRHYSRPMFPVLTATAERNNADAGQRHIETTKLAARQGKLGALRGPCRAAFFYARCRNIRFGVGDFSVNIAVGHRSSLASQLGLWDV